MTTKTILLGGATLLALASAAQAQERPRNIFPTRDVAVTYTVTDARRNSSSTVEMHWRGGGQEAQDRGQKESRQERTHRISLGPVAAVDPIRPGDPSYKNAGRWRFRRGRPIWD